MVITLAFELNTPGRYIIDIDGSAPLAGHQGKHAHLVPHNVGKKKAYTIQTSYYSTTLPSMNFM